MFSRALIQSGFCLALALPLTVACGGAKQGPPTIVQVQAGEMPSGHQWRGVYYSPVFGFLHITEENGAVVGAWRTASGDKWGELFGETNGDVLNYSWKEHKIGQFGPNATTEGKGYFRYAIPREGEAPEIQGEWGLEENNAGHKWNAIKQRNQEPDPKSVRPNELENRSGAEGWDDTKGDADLSGGAE